MEEAPEHQVEPLSQRDRLFALHKDMCRQALALMKKKNQDYSPGDNPFRNFERHGAFGISVRLDDKIARLETFIKRGSFEVDGESILDTCIDGINYWILVYVFLTRGQQCDSLLTNSSSGTNAGESSGATKLHVAS